MPGAVARLAVGWSDRERTLYSAYIYAFNGQADSEGPVNYDIYAAFNWVIDGNYRSGQGVTSVTVTIY